LYSAIQLFSLLSLNVQFSSVLFCASGVVAHNEQRSERIQFTGETFSSPSYTIYGSKCTRKDDLHFLLIHSPSLQSSPPPTRGYLQGIVSERGG